MSVILGLTGSIGMGKSTTAGFFHEAGVPVWDADNAVHRLYAPNRPAAQAIAETFPLAMNPDQSVNRDALRRLIAKDPTTLDRLNALVHPLVAKDRAEFLRQNEAAPLVVLDIPLLFETGGDAACDATLVVTASPDVQRSRVLERGMSEEDFEMMRDRQTPDEEKRRRATHVIETRTLEQTRADVHELIAKLTGGPRDA